MSLTKPPAPTIVAKPVAPSARPAAQRIALPAAQPFGGPKDRPIEFDAGALDALLDARRHHAQLEQQAAAALRQPVVHPGAHSGPADALSDQAVRVMAKLPPDLKVNHLAERYPRLMNLLAKAWGDPVHFFALVNDLMIDRRGDRAGLPYAVAMQLTRLAEHHEHFVAPKPAMRK